MNDARIARARIEGNVKGQRWLEAVHTMAERVRRRAAHGVGECAEVRRHFTDIGSIRTQETVSQPKVIQLEFCTIVARREARVHPWFSPQPSSHC